jgi:glutamine amidotransferase
LIAIIDYGAGNLGSVYKAFKHIGADVSVTSDPDEALRAEKLVLPGVGAFAHCMSGLASIRMEAATREFIASGRPFLGICVGLQMLFDRSDEMGSTPGLGVIPGRVVKFRFDTPTLKVPHIGWNSLSFKEDAALFKGLTQGDRVYFVHSYYPQPADASVASATTDYGSEFCSAVEQRNVHATQFHPEKSGEVGLEILRNFAALPS